MADYYAKVEDGVITRYNVRQGVPIDGISFSKNSGEADYLVHGYYPIVGSAPIPTTVTQTLVNVQESDLVLNINNQAVLGPDYVIDRQKVVKLYTTTYLTDEEIEVIQIANFRRYRDQLLLESDIYALADRMTPEITVYRQALRDLPSVTTAYTTVTFPVKPSELT